MYIRTYHFISAAFLLKHKRCDILVGPEECETYLT
jgi:hypothetical protein